METWVPIELQGIVIAAAWQPNGDVDAVDIAGYDEKRYRVADDNLGKKLRAYIKKKIIVGGLIETGTNSMVIHIRHFRIDTSDPVLTNPSEGG